MKKIISKIKQRLLNRHQKFYHLKNRWWLVHIFIDLILLFWVISLVGADILLYLNQPKATVYDYFQPLIKTPASELKETAIKNPSGSIKTPSVQAELNFKALVKYTLPEGDQIGLGPLPPRIGEKTRYWVFFSASADNGDFTELQTMGVLGKNVRLTGKSFTNSNYTIKYNEQNNSLVWTINEIKAEELTPLISAVEIEFIPTTDQIGQPATLIKQITIEAISSKTSQTVKKYTPDLTTAITEDTSGGIIR
jgi:hypothetical protein